MSGSVWTSLNLAALIGLEAAWPAWAAALAGALIVVLVWWTYGPALRRSWRIVPLAVLRGAAALLLLGVLLRPTLLIWREVRQRPALVVAIDVSASMARADVPAGDPQANLQTRLAAAVKGLAAQEGLLLADLAKRYDVRLVSLADRALAGTTITKVEQVRPALAWLGALGATEPRTDLAAAVRQVLASLEPDQPLAGLVLISDGRRNAGAPLVETADLLANLNGPAIGVVAGGEASVPDLRVASVQATGRAFVGEPVLISGTVESTGLSGAVEATVQLLDEAGGDVLAEQTVSLRTTDQGGAAGLSSPTGGTPGLSSRAVAGSGPAAREEFFLTFQPDRPGVRRLAVRLRGGVRDADPRNDEARFQVEAIDAKIRVLYVEAYPRYEYRFLKNLLVREPSIVSSCLLLSADAAFPQEGDEPVDRFPPSLEQLDRYDVVILGDLDPKAGWIDPPGLENLAKWVREKGGGLGFLAGARYGLAVWQDTPVGEVLPVRPGEGGAEPATAEGYRPTVTPEGGRSPILLLAAPDRRVDRLVEQLPEWFWAARAGPAKPAAETLLAHPSWRAAEGPVPLLVTGHYGAGRTLYCGSDEVWRWRQYDENACYKPFWLQAVRWLAGPRKLGPYRRVVLESQPPEAQLGQPMRLNLRIRDAELAANLPERIRVDLRDEQDRPAGEVWLRRAGESAEYSGLPAIDRAGIYTAQADLPGVEPPARAAVAVVLPDAETADAPADAAALRAWVQAVQERGVAGYVLPVTELDRLESLPLPGPTTRVRTAEVRLWDNPWALMLVAGLFLVEWAWRRARGFA